MKKTLLFRQAILIILMLFSIWSCAKVSGQGSVTMIVSGSVHGQLDPCGWKKNPLGGLSRRYVKINEIRQDGNNPILLDAGDMFFSTKNLNKNNIESERYRANVMLDAYQNIGYDALNIGIY